MYVSKKCLTCEKADEDCTDEIVAECLSQSVCEHCDGTRWGYPYGKDESRHCNSCGAEWSVYK